ncbi:MAG: DUF1638 domain-containing protein [candidate division WS1 bacterium]|jgi:N-methylhydantoinase A/oxoprolinase/acetone carboxylase beta subunit|nr:DUF1638 domain-containing protein [candidate division WS1 bacterium]
MRLKVVACGVFESELGRLSRQSANSIDLVFLDAGLHEEPERIRSELQRTIDEAEGHGYDAVVAAYGLCGRGTAGIIARTIPVVLLRVHDCITLFLGSRDAYMEQFRRHPGTFYITPGWYDKKVRRSQSLTASRSSQPHPENDPRYAAWADRFGAERARFLIHFHDSWKRNYTRAVYIDTCAAGQCEQVERYARDLAAAMGWRYERLDGSSDLLADAIEGRWGSGNMLVLQPGQCSVATTGSSVLDAVDSGHVSDASAPPPSQPPMETHSSDDHMGPSQPAGAVALGIDAGGTYTDCVVYDFRSKYLIAKAKALTTHHDLSVGIQSALDRLPTLPTDEIALVALSTTLATNSIAEGKGGRPGALLMAPFSLRADAIKWPLAHKISGAMTVGGVEIEPPNPTQVRQMVHRLLADSVDAFAISGYGSVRNPSHENIVREIVEQECDLPVVCGHHLSAGLNYLARANAAILNGRLLGVTYDLISAVKSSLHSRGIETPLMVVKGDGSLINEATALQRPVDTAFSGPAASAVGARFLTKMTDGLVFDMGGTTTDAAVIVGGMPRLNLDGARINGWRTSVPTADIATIGLGGDSHISFTLDRRLRIGPRRVIPLSYLAAQDKSARDELMALNGSLITERTSADAIDFFVLGTSPRDLDKLSGYDAAVVRALQSGPLSRAQLASRLRLSSPQLLRTEPLEAAGYLQRSALTPTDLLHATGELTVWDTQAATHALNLFAALYGDQPEALVVTILDQIVRRLCLQVLTCASDLPDHETGECGCSLCASLLHAGLSEQDGNPLQVQFTCNRDLVAIGAPVAAFFPQVAHRLNANLVIPEHAEVANAIGAVASEVIVHEKTVVRPTEAGAFVAHSRDSRREYSDLERAIAFATTTARELALQHARDAGAVNPAVRTEVDRRMARIADGSMQLIEVSVTATAAGRPLLSPSYAQHKGIPAASVVSANSDILSSDAIG